MHFKCGVSVPACRRAEEIMSVYRDKVEGAQKECCLSEGMAKCGSCFRMM